MLPDLDAIGRRGILLKREHVAPLRRSRQCPVDHSLAL